MKLFTYLFNNYYNREIRGFHSVADYTTYAVNGTAGYPILNFNFGDGVDTTCIIGTAASPVEKEPDYVVLCDDSNNILSRWFVLDCTYLRGEQYTISLRRDVIFDYGLYDIDAQISRGWCSQTNNLILADEGFRFNQVKKSQDLIKDKIGCQWIYGYLDSKYAGGTFTIPADLVEPLNINTSATTFANWTYYNYTNYGTSTYNRSVQGSTKLRFDAWQKFEVRERILGIEIVTKYKVYTYSVTIDSTNKTTISDTLYGTYLTNTAAEAVIPNDQLRFYDMVWNDGATGRPGGWAAPTIGTPAETKKYLSDVINTFGYSIPNVTASQFNTHVSSHTQAEINTFENVAGTWYFSLEPSTDNRFKKIKANISNVSDLSDATTNASIISALRTIFDANNHALRGTHDFPTTFDADCIEMSGRVDKHTLTATPFELPTATENNLTVTIPAQAVRRHCINSAYDVFAIPLDCYMKRNSTAVSGDKICQEQYSRLMASYLASQLGSNLYDIQLLPYAPLPMNNQIEQIAPSTTVHPGQWNGFYYGDLTEHTDYEWIEDVAANDTRTTRGVCLFLSNIDYTYYIPKTISVSDYKIESNTDSYRLNSPNWSSSFEFNLAKNGGLNGFNVSMTLKPHQPYINIQPVFNKLYGTNFTDARGLICGGDFTYPTFTDRWAEFLINNKNYEASFDREVSSIEMVNKFQMIGDITSAATGALQAGAISSVGLGIGGGLAVGALSAAAGAVDVWANKKVRDEQLNLKKDLHAMNTQNIQAQPNTLNSVGAENASNTKFPTIEKYSCTDEELESFKDYLRLRSYTINVYGKVLDYVNQLRGQTTFIQATPVKIPQGYGETHLYNAIASELQQGIYVIN